ncbi:MAG: acyltransferase [bacterium]|nr:acyltransferase [bacterium]
MDLFFVGFFIIVFWGVKLAPKGEFAEDVLSKERGNVLRGVFILGIMLHHLSQRTDNGKLFWIFLYVGSLAVGIYLFLSGYGLMKQYQLRGEAYLSSFLVKRMSKILIPYLIANIVYIIGYTLLGKKIKLMEVLKSFTTGDPYVLFSWYMISIFFFYLEFYLVHRFCKKKLLIVILDMIFLAGYVAVCAKINTGAWWYNTSIVFFMGKLWAENEEAIMKFLKKGYLVKLILSFVLSIGLYILSLEYEYGSAANIAWMWIDTGIFIVFVIMLNMKLIFSNKLLVFWGHISFEVFLYHGFMVTLFKTRGFRVTNDVLMSLGVIIGGTLLGFLFSKGDQLILKKLIKA